MRYRIGRRRRAAVCAAVVFACAQCAASANAADPFAPRPVEVRASQVILSHDDFDRTRVGRLDFRGGLDLRSRDERFGGLSGLDVSADGSRLTAVGDQGIWFTARIGYDARGRLAGLSETAIAAIREIDGRPVVDRWRRDAESIARLADGSLIVGFERLHRLRRYAAPGAIAFPVAPPADLGKSPENGGAEGLTRLADGRLLLFSERLERRPGVAAGWVSDGAGHGWQGVDYRLRPPFRPVGADTGPDGAVYVLERRFTTVGGIGSRIVRLAPGAIRPGAELTGEELAEWSPPLVADNFEGIAVRRAGGGETLIYVVSDDNFNPLQRTLLLLFALAE